MLVVATTERLGDANVPCLPANHATGSRAKPLFGFALVCDPGVNIEGIRPEALPLPILRRSVHRHPGYSTSPRLCSPGVIGAASKLRFHEDRVTMNRQLQQQNQALRSLPAKTPSSHASSQNIFSANSGRNSLPDILSRRAAIACRRYSRRPVFA